ncbi:MAG: hypothetical protein AB7O67_13945 [Vicinamibacterales bacterium]
MPSTRLRDGLIVLSLVLLAGLPSGATPGFWQAATQADFLRGEIDQLSLDIHGRLTLGPRLERIHDPGVPFIWSTLPGPDDSVYLGTGNDGQILKVTRAGQASVFYDAQEMAIYAMAAVPGGGIYAATSPDGRIYKISADGQAEPFFDPQTKYIWSLAVDTQGNVFAATGDKGDVYRIRPDGTGAVFFSTRATNAVTLAFDPTGQLLVGTGSPGRVFRVDAGGKGFLLLDTQYEEAHALRVTPEGVIYVAAQSGRPSGGGGGDDTATTEPARPAPVPSVSTEITSIAIIDAPVTPQPASAPQGGGDARGPTGAVYRIAPDGLWDEVWASRDEAPYDLALEEDGALLVATGSNGRLLRLSGDPLRPTLVTRVPARQTTRLYQAGGRTWLATANPGLLLALSPGRADRGTYESDVKDARIVSSWGTLSWRATSPTGTRVELFTRSGNTRSPDETWSDWAGPYASADGSQISSPKARYLQWRAVLTGGDQTPVLTSVTAAYLQRNVRPQVSSITVHPPGVVFQKPFSTGEAEIAGFSEQTLDARLANQGQGAPGAPALGRRVYQKGLQTFVWKADDENGDDIRYDVLYRREADTSWKTLDRNLTEPILVWDTTSVPNGTYVVKIVASDAQSNPPDLALAGELESTSFDIDNTPPTVSVTAPRRDGDRFVIAIEVRDADSPAARVEYSVDGQRWQSIFPQDGILDGRVERFELRLPADLAGRTLVVRASDAMNNLGSGQTALR